MTILSHLLRKEHREAGLTLEDSVDFVYLKKGGKTLAKFSSARTTLEDILKEADQQENWIKSGIVFEEAAK